MAKAKITKIEEAPATVAVTVEPVVEVVSPYDKRFPVTVKGETRVFRLTHFNREWTVEQDEAVMEVIADVIPVLTDAPEGQSYEQQAMAMFRVIAGKKHLARILATFYVEDGTDWDGDDLEAYEAVMRKAKGGNDMLMNALRDFFGFAGSFITGGSRTSSPTT